MVVAKVYGFRHFSKVPISFVKVPDMVTFFRRKLGYEHRSGEPSGKTGGMLPPEYVLFEVKLSEMLFPVFLRLEKQYQNWKRNKSANIWHQTLRLDNDVAIDQTKRPAFGLKRDLNAWLMRRLRELPLSWSPWQVKLGLVNEKNDQVFPFNGVPIY